MATRTLCPLPANLEEGKTHAWCRCGLSQTAPLCDGSHKGTEHKPHLFVADATKTAYLCGCAASERPPYCDGSHCDVTL